MSIKAIAWVWDHSQSEGAARLVLLAIADCANASGGDAWPSMAELCRKTRLSERGVQKAIRRLEEVGELRVTGNAGRGRTNRYSITMETPHDVRGFDTENPERRSPRTEFAPEPGSPQTPNVVRETPNHVHPEPSEPSFEPSVASQPDRAPSRPAAPSGSAEIPEWATPLVRRIQPVMPGLRWNLRGDDWFMVAALIKSKGVDAMADHAARAAESSNRPIVSARYFLGGWKELPAAAPDGSSTPTLRAVPTTRQQAATNAVFDRAYAWAEHQDALEIHGEP